MVVVFGVYRTDYVEVVSNMGYVGEGVGKKHVILIML